MHNKNGSTSRGAIRMAAIVCLLAGAVESVSGTDATWTGASNSTWTNTFNWSPTNAFPDSSGQATFNGPGNGNTNIVLGRGIRLNGYMTTGMVFDTANAAAYTISGGVISNGSNSGIYQINASVVNNQALNATMMMQGTAAGYACGYFRNLSPVAVLSLGGTFGIQEASSTNNYLVSQGLGSINVPGRLIDGNVDGSSTSKFSIINSRAGTTTLTGTNTFSGIDSAKLGYNIQNDLCGTLVLDYTNMAVSGGVNTTTVVPNGSAMTSKTIPGTLVFRGIADPSVTTRQAMGMMNFVGGETVIVVDKNGGAGTMVTFTNTWNAAGPAAYIDFDLSSGGQARLSSPTFAVSCGYSNLANGNIVGTYASYNDARVTITGTDGKTYVGGVDGSGNIIRQTSLPALATNTSDAVGNYALTGSLTAKAGIKVNSLRIEPTAPGQVFDLGGKTLYGANYYEFILKDGAYDYAITNFAQYTYGGGITFSVYGTGKLTVGPTVNNVIGGPTYKTSFFKTGPGLMQLTGNNTNFTGGTAVYRGVLRIDSTNALPSGGLSLAGILELGCDFTRAWGNAAGQVCPGHDSVPNYGASCGFSTYGGSHYVNLGGFDPATNITWNGATTMSLAAINSKLLLSSAYSDGTIDFRNRIDLAGYPETVEVADGSAVVDAMLSGRLN